MIRKLIRKARHWFRSSISGRFVTRHYADQHPESTERESK